MARHRRRRRTRSRGRAALRAFALSGGLAVVGVAFATAIFLAVLRTVDPPTTAFMLRSRTADPATGRPCERVEFDWVDWELLPKDLPLAVLVAEDQRFFQHRGFDLAAIDRALRERDGRSRVRGASTITQQVAKNVFLWPGRSLVRKAFEAWFAAGIELAWPKRRILEVYLNVAQFGPCVFGAEAASQRFFGSDARSLPAEHAALLAAVLPNPLRLRAHDPGPYAQGRRAEILELMEQHRAGPIAANLRRVSRR